MSGREVEAATYDLCSWCDGDGDDGCGWHCLRCDGSGMVEVYGDPDDDDRREEDQ